MGNSSTGCRDNVITHNGVFFTTNKAAAKSYGSNICQTRIINNSSFFDANSNEFEMEKLRLELLKTEMGAKCIYTESSSKWKIAWKQSLVFGFYLSSCASLNAKLYGEETNRTILVKKRREWVEDICSILKKMGYGGLFIENRKRFGGKRLLKTYKVFVAFSLDVIEPPKWLWASTNRSLHLTSQLTATIKSVVRYFKR